MPTNDPTAPGSRPPGPRRRKGAPVGPEAVRRAILDAAAELFAARGVEVVSLRDIAAKADVQLSLIGRYIGRRDELIAAVFDDLTVRLAQEVVDRPLEEISFERESVMGRWTVLLDHLVVTQPDDPPRPSAFNPVVALAEVIEGNYGLDREGARVRGAQIVASALGWRIFEDYLIAAGSLEDLDRTHLRSELTVLHRRVGATPWPSPADPRIRRRKR